MQILCKMLEPGFPRWTDRNGMIHACFPCESRVFGHSYRGIPWVTGDNAHFAFNSTANSSSNSAARRLRVMQDYCPFANWMKHSV